MASKLNFTSISLLELEFTPNVRGYDATQVDMTLDQIIEDLKYYEDFKLKASEYIKDLETEVGKLRTKVRDNEVELARLKGRLGSIQDSPQVSLENVNLLKRISKLEEALYKKGVDPSKI